MIKFYIACLLFLPFIVKAHELRVEGAVADFSRNEIAVPGDRGNLFDTTEGDWKQKNGVAYRLYYTHLLSDKSSLRFLFAPLQTSFEGTFDQTTNFNGTLFNPGKAQVEYQFNSYRIAYHREFYENDLLTMNYGIVAKVRDAYIKVKQNNYSKIRKDLGVVPLLHFDARYKISKENSFYFDVDGLVAPQGRALDGGLFLERNIMDSYTAFVGYRFLDGGVDNDKVKTFSFVNYYTVGLNIKF